MTYGTTEDAPSLTRLPVAGPARYEPGSRPMIDLAAFGASMDLFLETGIDRIAQEAEWLAKRLLHGLRERGYEIQSPHGQFHRGAIVNFKPGAGARYTTLEGIETALKSAGVSFAKRAGGIRLSPHAFNTIEDLERVWKAVERYHLPK
jgi:selenocysteine lyase/cysteine desulfurase